MLSVVFKVLTVEPQLHIGHQFAHRRRPNFLRSASGRRFSHSRWDRLSV